MQKIAKKCITFAEKIRKMQKTKNCRKHMKTPENMKTYHKNMAENGRRKPPPLLKNP
uniref:Uncharacterized protein n=1 Tax=Nelumbo nucifera TaxID=4432 RepID=A0A822YNN9_NELNU|nr:TPA_asm: hypothetical protein HUJ06_011790 [Nelumbo nucifera]